MGGSIGELGVTELKKVFDVCWHLPGSETCEEE